MLALGIGTSAAEPPGFERDIQPILASRCAACHGPKVQEGKFRVDLRERMLKGGDSGDAAIVPGKSAASHLLARVTSADSSERMPPEGEKLTAEQVAKLKAWIDSGAAMPESFAVSPTDAQKHWAFQSVVRPKVPALSDAWVETEIDAFILERLRAKGLKPAAAADRVVLIRRLTYDLIGLPPTIAEVEAFLADEAPDAYERLVDRLLSSPGYGERWGRHWLDVARYADTNGLDENVAHATAWRYRDYVIAAFNADLPYDRFLQEQLAGDLLPAADERARQRQLIATGYLAIGPKVLAEVDQQKMEMDIIDEQIDTMSKSVLGLTLSCARCHDHKFDPIPTTDYYALAGIFKSTRTMESLAKIAKWNENDISSEADKKIRAEHAAAVAAKKGEVESAVKSATQALLASLPSGAAPPAKPEEMFPPETKQKLAALRAALAALEKTSPALPTAIGVSEGKATDLAVHVRGSHLSLGEMVPRRFPGVIAGATPVSVPKEKSGRLELAHWLTAPSNPLTARVFANRLWRWHFGRGLVASVDNFGELGEKPSHPALLDYLASELMASGWSVKAVQRKIVLSSTYRQQTNGDSRGLEIDPENRLLYRRDPRRLEAEELRDALLAASGGLDPTMGGSLLQTANRAHVFDHTSKDMTKYDFPRRSVYLPVVRNHLYDLFQLFDYADAGVVEGDRPTSIVPQQALFLLNSPLVINAADKLAARTLGETMDDAARVRQLYLATYGRAPTATEIERARQFVAREAELQKKRDPSQAQHRAWSLFCQSLLAANEFLTVR